MRLKVGGWSLKVVGCWLLVVGCWLGAWAEGQGTRLDVTSHPQGVTVYVDGTDRGVTPLSVFDLKPGRHHLRCSLAGYEEHDQFFALESGRALAINDVVMAPVKGLLLVKSEPDGCNIAIDGVSVGTTPRLVTTLDAKDTHQVTLRKTGYRPTTFEVRFSGRTPVVRSETLILDSGVIDVITDPAGAEVTVNGIVRGTSPVKVKDVPKGRATVRLRMEGYAEETRELAMNAGDSQTLSVSLKGLPGTMGLTTLPPGGRFYVNGEPVGKSPVTLFKLKPGDYEVRAEVDGYAPLTRTVTIANGTSVREEFRLENVMGRLEVRTSPAGAELVMDGKVVGRTKTSDRDAEFSDVFSIENLMEGEHVLTVRCHGYAEATRHPKIRTGKTAHANVRMKRVLVPDVRITTDSGSYDGMLINQTPDYVTVEISLGVQRTFSRGEIVNIKFLSGEKK